MRRWKKWNLQRVMEYEKRRVMSLTLRQRKLVFQYPLDAAEYDRLAKLGRCIASISYRPYQALARDASIWYFDTYVRNNNGTECSC